MSSLCFVCQLPILSHQTWGTWPHHQDSDTDQEDEGQPDDDEEGERQEDARSSGDDVDAAVDRATGHRRPLRCNTPEEKTLTGDAVAPEKPPRARRPSQPVVTPQRRRSSASSVDWEGGDTFHEDCLVCDTCGLRLAGSSWQGAHRFENKIYCGLHYADVTGLSSGEEFLAKLREYKRQSLGCAEARRKSSTTLTFPVPVQVRNILVCRSSSSSALNLD